MTSRAFEAKVEVWRGNPYCSIGVNLRTGCLYTEIESYGVASLSSEASRTLAHDILLAEGHESTLDELLDCARNTKLTTAAFSWQHIKTLADEIARLQGKLASSAVACGVCGETPHRPECTAWAIKDVCTGCGGRGRVWFGSAGFGEGGECPECSGTGRCNVGPSGEVETGIG